MKRIAIVLLSAAVTATAFADPPSHAPAHGWRKKHDPYYQGYSGKKWDKDYGILQGRCDAKSLGETLGKTVGGAIGAKVGDGQGREVAVIVGEILGQVVGNRVLGDMRDIDATDRACLAQALELAKGGQRVAWTNPVNKARYLLTPQGVTNRDGRQCRDFSVSVDNAGRKETVTRSACASAAGSWEIAR